MIKNYIIIWKIDHIVYSTEDILCNKSDILSVEFYYLPKPYMVYTCI